MPLLNIQNLWSTDEPDCCIDCGKYFDKKKTQLCNRCKGIVCTECIGRHPTVLLPAYFGMVKFKQSVCNTCFNVICSRKSEFVIRKDGKNYPAGEIPNGLVACPSETELQQHDMIDDENHDTVENPCSICRNNPNLILPNMNIIIILVGSRGDVQPFLGYAEKLIEEGHHVRIATHEHHRAFVNRYDVDFYPIAGDPAELMEFMVENQLKSVQGFTNKITNHRKWVKELCYSSWEACTTSLEIGVSYRADVIMANPPSFVGVHIAEKLSIPLIMSFTMPWTATSEFPSPFVRTPSGPTRNFYSYMALDRIIWVGIRAIINKWREEQLHLSPIRTFNFSGHRLLYDLKVPYIYCFSEKLLPKPKDWGCWVGVSGFYFLETKRNWNPPAELQRFLDDGEPPVYIGFGSIVVADPAALIECVMAAIELVGCRAIVQPGWAKMVPEYVPDHVLIIQSAPHDWLFEQCSAVVHHGGAGTTATSLRAGKPTVVVPFFGDQFFWGNTIAKMELGPEPVPSSTITPEKLAEAIQFALQPSINEKAKQCGIEMKEERGIENGVELLKKFLPIEKMCCSTCNNNVAKIFCRDCNMKFCLDCNNVVHANWLGFEGHVQEKHRIVNWKQNARWWGPTANALADGTTSFTEEFGVGFVEAVNCVSDGQGVTGKVTGVGKGLFSFASGVATGTTRGIATTVHNISSPSYVSGSTGRIEKQLRVDSRASSDLSSIDTDAILTRFRSCVAPELLLNVQERT